MPGWPPPPTMACPQRGPCPPTAGQPTHTSCLCLDKLLVCCETTQEVRKTICFLVPSWLEALCCPLLDISQITPRGAVVCVDSHYVSLPQVDGVRLLPGEPQPPIHPGPQHRPPSRPSRQGPPQRRGPDPVPRPGPETHQPAPRWGCGSGETRGVPGEDPIGSRGPGRWRSHSQWTETAVGEGVPSGSRVSRLM